MNRQLLTYALLLYGFSLAPCIYGASRGSANFTMESDAFTSAGGITSSASFTLEGSLGQPVPAGSSQSSGYFVLSGINTIPDTDHDGSPDDIDADDDGDGVSDLIDAFPRDMFESVDTDGDGIGNNTDLDDDGDGVADVNDDYPLDPLRTSSAGDDDGSIMNLIILIKKELDQQAN